MSAFTVVLLIAIITTGLSAGIFYGYAVSVNGGLGSISDRAYLSAMQSINRVILNLFFFIVFFGPVVLLPVSTWLQFKEALDTRFYMLLVSALIYLVGTFGVTAFGNVPLNRQLARIDLEQATAQQLAKARADFETPWNRFHAVRTVAATTAFLLLVLSMLVS